MNEEKSRYDLESVRIDEFFKEVAAQAAPLIRPTQILRLVSCADLPAVELFLDKKRIERALTALFLCVVRAGQETSEIELLLDKEREKIVFSIRAVQAASKDGTDWNSELAEARRTIERHGGELSRAITAQGSLIIRFWLPSGELAQGC